MIEPSQHPALHSRAVLASSTSHSSAAIASADSLHVDAKSIRVRRPCIDAAGGRYRAFLASLFDAVRTVDQPRVENVARGFRAPYSYFELATLHSSAARAIRNHESPSCYSSRAGPSPVGLPPCRARSSCICRTHETSSSRRHFLTRMACLGAPGRKYRARW